jgi:hypothetical protein
MERRSELSGRAGRRPGDAQGDGDGGDGGGIGDPRLSLAQWLQERRLQRGLSLDDVARVTKIQARILERLEAGDLDGLPAEVFVRGFVRSFARCVGLDEDEASRRYAACGAPSGRGSRLSGPIPTSGITPSARALVEAMADLVPGSARTARTTAPRMLAVDPDLAAGSLRDVPIARIDAGTSDGTVVETMMLPETGTVVISQLVAAPAAAIAPPAPREPIPPSEPDVERAAAPVVSDAAPVAAPPAIEVVDASVAGASRKKRRRRKRAATQAGAEPGGRLAALVAATPPAASPVVLADAADVSVEEFARPVEPASPAVVEAAADEAVGGEPWSPTMPPIAAVPTVPWRRPAYAAVTPAPAPAPVTLVIDDADPESAERVQEARADRADRHPRRSFLPPILLDREDRSARQGGLTLAVIILLIAATLTLSYLMRRPSASGDGMTMRETPAATGGLALR